ncbi:hypothetical protein F5887DRAFT_1007405 [Amanita rubescens]|nr:hypothetical protein F5887DRAFT_1007405 [Amanita rubescens]
MPEGRPTGYYGHVPRTAQWLHPGSPLPDSPHSETCWTMRTLTNLLALSLVMPVVFAVRFTIQPNKWVKTLHKNTFWEEIKVKRTNIVAFYSSSLADKTSLSHYIEAAEQLHPLVSSFAVNCDKDLDESLCEELKINTKESLFRVSVMVFPRGTELKTVVLPEQTLLPKDIISQVQGAVPNYIVVLNDIKGITAWADKIREPAVKKQDKQKGLILDKVDKISNHDISAHAQSALVKESEPKYRALLLVRAEVIPFSWRVLANQYYGKMSFGITLNANANVQKQLGLEKNMKIVVFRADSERIPYKSTSKNGNKFEVVVNFLNTVLDGTSHLYEFST